MKESALQRDVRLHLGQKPDLIIWRNNAGRVFNEESQQWIQYGLCVGSSDLIGVLTVPCEWPLQCLGRFFAAEIKTRTGRVTPEQDAFLALVNAKGGYACVIRSVEEAEEHYQRARKGLNAP